jgi:RNA polymerase sigma factor for flagellar operon FliA
MQESPETTDIKQSTNSTADNKAGMQGSYRGAKEYDRTDEEKAKADKRRELVEEYSSLVRKVARRIRRRLPPHIKGIEEEDLVSLGIIGLFEAWEKYDPSYGSDFETFAEFRIKGNILDELRKKDFFPRRLRQKANKLKSAEEDLQRELGREPTEEEVAEELDVTVEKLQEIRSEVAPYSFVDTADVSYTLQSADPSPFRLVNFKEHRDRLQHALEELPERKQLVLDLYYNKELTLKQIGDVLELTPGRISQLKSDAISDLRDILD